MNNTQRINLSENISDQKTGIFLVFSPYSNGLPGDWGFITHTVPKTLVSKHPGKGSTFALKNSAVANGAAAEKYLYIADYEIIGYDDNGSGAAASWVLRYVVGY